MNENTYGIEHNRREDKFFITAAEICDIVYFETFADALGAKLLQSIKNGWITAEEANNRLMA